MNVHLNTHELVWACPCFYDGLLSGIVLASRVTANLLCAWFEASIVACLRAVHLGLFGSTNKIGRVKILYYLILNNKVILPIQYIFRYLCSQTSLYDNKLYLLHCEI